MDRTAPEGRDLQSGAVADFERLEVPLLNPSIRSSQTMVWFEGRVVVGTARAALGAFDRVVTRIPGRASEQDAPSRERNEDGAQIVTFDPVTRSWHKIYDSPLIAGSGGGSRARDRGIRAAIVCQTAADTKPCLYAAASALEGNVVFLRSDDSCWVQECAGSGFNLDVDVPSVGTMACLRGRLFSAPMGKHDSRGVLDDTLTEYPVVLESRDPMSGNWVTVSEPGFGDPENLSISKLAVFEDHLYAATLNPRRGLQLWKTDADGSPPYRWHKIIDAGAWLGAISGAPAGIAVFREALYLSATVHRHRHQNLDRFGPFPAEMIRMYADGKWELVTGKMRCTPHGLRVPVSGLSGGFGNPFTRAFSHLMVHRGWLYAGATSWRLRPSDLRDRTDLSPERLERLRAATTEHAAARNWALWRTPDGVAWENIANHDLPGTGPRPHGIREMLSTPHGLFIAPNVATPGRPTELWWGHF